MNTTKKMILTAGLFLQISASLYADAWLDALNVFGGPAAAYSNRGSMSWTQALGIAKQNGASPELLAVAMFESDGNPAILVNKFQGAAPQSALNNALQNLMNANAPVRTAPQPVVQPVMQQPVVQQPAPASSGYGYLSGSSSAPSSDNSAAIQSAVAAQKKADVANATAKDQNLAAIANSGKSGFSLYSAYVDALFNLLQQAINSIADASTAQQVVQYIQNKAANLSVSASANRYNSRTLGRMNSKKGASKKVRNHRSSSTR